MKKVIKTIEKEIASLKADLEGLKGIITGSMDDIAAYNSAVKVIGPKLEELNKLNKVLVLIKDIQDSPIEVEDKPKSKRGRPKKNQ